MEIPGCRRPGAAHPGRRAGGDRPGRELQVIVIEALAEIPAEIPAAAGHLVQLS